MSKVEKATLFTELTVEESATVSGGDNTPVFPIVGGSNPIGELLPIARIDSNGAIGLVVIATNPQALIKL